jgi:DNA-binding NarL/FixJ family response regulator
MPLDSSVPPPAATALKNHVLIADDDDLGRRSLCRLLEREGYFCHEANTSDAARQVTASGDVSLIIADINMEGNNRLEFIKEVRAIKKPVSIILVTGHASVETAAAATALNAAAYLLKPLNPQELLQIVRSEFEQQSLFRAMQAHRHKQEYTLQSMREVEEALVRTRGAGTRNALESYVALSFEQAMQSLLDLRALMEPLLGHCARQQDLKQLNTSRPLLLVNAIQETIQVLDGTRHSFKSKELATLRHKLEALLKSAPPGASATPRDAS